MIQELLKMADQGLPPDVIAEALKLPLRDVVTILQAENASYLIDAGMPELLENARRQTDAFSIRGLPYPQATFRLQGGGGATWRQLVHVWMLRHPDDNVSAVYAGVNSITAQYGRDVSFYTVQKWFKYERKHGAPNGP